jgi:hypothetical protein
VYLKLKRPAAAKLDFIIAGVQKAATTALSDLLEIHPKIKMPHRDELHRTIQPARHFLMTKSGSPKARLITRRCTGAARATAIRF